MGWVWVGIASTRRTMTSSPVHHSPSRMVTYTHTTRTQHSLCHASAHSCRHVPAGEHLQVGTACLPRSALLCLVLLQVKYSQGEAGKPSKHMSVLLIAVRVHTHAHTRTHVPRRWCTGLDGAYSAHDAAGFGGVWVVVLRFAWSFMGAHGDGKRAHGGCAHASCLCVVASLHGDGRLRDQLLGCV